jgi:hypothetical protein
MTILQAILAITHLFLLTCGYYLGHNYGLREGIAIGVRRGQAIRKAVN